MIRSLLFDFSHDEIAKSIEDEFMFGYAILVCPVTEPMYYETGSVPINKEKKRLCYLPQGVGWYDFWTGTRYEGGQYLTMNAPLDEIPLFVKEGSILPMETGLQYAQQVSTEVFQIHIYPGKDAIYNHYEDVSDGFQYKNGEYNLIEMRWDEKSKIFSIGASDYDFPQSVKGRDCELILNERHVKFHYDGKPLKVKLV
jgi:alpha-D-xyloside xylohydrolase